MELINPGLGLIFWMLIAFGILLFILGKFVWPPVLRALNEREESIEQALHEADKAREEMKTLLYNNDKLKLEAEEQRDKLIMEARQMRDILIEEARIKATEEAERLIVNARERIHFDKMAAITDLKNQIATLSIDIAEKILKSELSEPKKQKEFVEKSLEQINLN
ncbi:MAG: F0F1 ATP synthase subunit B [Lentimicrobiaceae bacterium]|jgi:F-type H+-transporting ATPase subunit b|nr:F0F1 ATP synthase subunit B [Lentimicrobiaceae bacterium]MDD4598938.1 F0F1 ATP synthase subunit B [Lentimicrobiaceae bacterium]MDY0026485.1 F0F1 ATP synthase subunit B [Lentimicrobium sp.]HAH60069.1 ATP synthase F0 subunit B [Bacteroidales bacterium]